MHFRRGYFPLTILLALPATACQPSYFAVKDSLLLMQPPAGAQSPQTKSGLTVTVEPVYPWELEEKAPPFCSPMSVFVCREKGGAGGGELYVGPARPRTRVANAVGACAPRVDVAMAIRLRNDTERSLDVGTATVQLESGDGKTFSPLAKGATCRGRAARAEGAVDDPDAWPSPTKVLPGK